MANREALAAELASYAIHDPKHEESVRIQDSQLRHRLDLLSCWFEDLATAKAALAGSKIVEIGCGQGDTTIALAWAAGSEGKVYGIDPAPLDYGTPYTLAQAQGHLLKSPVGATIEWVQADPVDVLQSKAIPSSPDYVILAHSMLYMQDEAYLSSVLRAIAQSGASKLLLAEWGMCTADERAKAHVYAVEAQAAQPLHQGNVQMCVEPYRVVQLAEEAGWKVDYESWLESPELDDGRWEVAATRAMLKSEDLIDEARLLGQKMEESIRSYSDVRCMDVWTSVFVKK